MRRPYQGEEDYWRIRSFLREAFLLNDRHELCWHVARLDYWRWHFIENCQVCGPVENVIWIWETSRGEIAAVLHPMAMGEAFVHVHPASRTAELEQEIIAFSELSVPARDPDGKRYLTILVDSGDTLRQNVLIDRGYAKGAGTVHRWWRDVDAPLPQAPITPGYAIRSMGDIDEFPARSWASWKAFHPDEPDEHYEGWEWLLNIRSAPLYRRDLDLVAATPRGEIAAFCTIWFDDATRSAVCVLVGTVPDHQRRGLGTAVIFEGLHRLRRMGATRAFANAYDPAANALYGSVLGTRAVSESWVKEF